MSRTNHRRGTSDNRFNIGQRASRYFRGYGETPLSDQSIQAHTMRSGKNSKSTRRDRKGAKKYIASRTRFHENRALEKLLQEGAFDN